MSSVVYVEIDIFAALVLGIIMDHNKSYLFSKNQKIFKKVLISIIWVLILDAFCWLFNGADFQGAKILNNLITYLYWFASLFPCYMGLMYCSYMVQPAKYKMRKWVYSIPIWIGAILLALNYYTHWIFVISDKNVYERGPFFLMVGALPFIHMIIAVILTIKKYVTSPVFERSMYAMLAIFMCVPLLGSLLQIFIYGIVTIWTGLTLTMLMSYVYIQRGNLNMDALTHVNNRGRFDTYANWKWEHLSQNDNLYLAILDINRFKFINDNFGHGEGDEALKKAANVLRKVANEEKGFLARIGGDEFALLFENIDNSKMEEIQAKIHAEMKNQNQKNNCPYEISFAIGYAYTTGVNKKEFAKCFSEADGAMYRDKKRI